jgi:hypothetical protein
MRQEAHSSEVKFRVRPPLLDAAKRRADVEGMTLSEFLRAAVRDKLREAA